MPTSGMSAGTANKARWEVRRKRLKSYSARMDAQLTGPTAEFPAMVNWLGVLGLPLVDHLVEQCLFRLAIAIPPDMAPAQADLHRGPGPPIESDLAQPALHATGD